MYDYTWEQVHTLNKMGLTSAAFVTYNGEDYIAFDGISLTNLMCYAKRLNGDLEKIGIAHIKNGREEFLMYRIKDYYFVVQAYRVNQYTKKREGD